MSGIVLALSLLACFLVISEACNKSSQGGSTGVTQSPADGDNSYGPGSGPVPPHPFRRRRGGDDVSDDSALALQSQAMMTKMMTRLFAELDSNNDQSVSSEEWVRRRGNAEDYRQVLAQFNRNDDNLLSFDEFLAASKS